MKEKLKDIVEDLKESLWEISDYIYHHPELGDQEYLSSEKLSHFLSTHGFSIEKGLVGRPTSFRAIYDSGKQGPTIAYLCEYDALPEIGHGCGHNMIGTMGAGASVALSKLLDKIGGRVIALGTPAEETNGAKVPMAEQGVFDHVDVALMLHPSGESYESGDSLAMDAIQFTYHGKSAHAAASPHEGINALDAVIQLFNGINALRQHVKDDVRIHGIISKGGVAANVVPDLAQAQFYVRASERSDLDQVVDKVRQIAEGAAQMTGATLEMENYELSYDNMVTNQPLSKAFTANMKAAGVGDIKPKESGGSIDMGNVSHVVPAIHPYIGLEKPDLIGHTRELAQLTISEVGKRTLINGVLALAFTGFDVITNKELLSHIKEDFQLSQSK